MQAQRDHDGAPGDDQLDAAPRPRLVWPDEKPSRSDGVMTALLLLLVAALAPWIVHLAPPRQRPLALVGVVGVFLLFGIFTSANPITAWESWVGLAVGVIAAAGVATTW